MTHPRTTAMAPVSGRAPWRSLLATLAVLLAAVLGAAVLGAPAALAHDGGTRYAAVLDSIDPPLPGAKLGVVTTDLGSQFVLDNPTPTLITILDQFGDPFLQIGAGGVQGNFRSPDWYTTKTNEGPVPIPAGAAQHLTPLWVRVSKDPQWGWFDERLHPVNLAPPAQAQPDAAFGSWQVPIQYGTAEGTAPGTIRGHFQAPVTLGAFTASIEPAQPAPGITALVVPSGARGILLSNHTPDDVTVLGTADEPFLRLGPAGAFANLRSPTYQSLQALQGESSTVPADPAAPPQWEQVGGGTSYAWVDTRPAVQESNATLALLSQPTVLQHWSIPLLVGGQRVEIQGTTSFTPAVAANAAGAGGGFAGAFTTPLLIIGAVLAAATFAMLYLRTRRRTGDAHDA